MLAIRGSVQFDLPVALSSSASYLPLEAGVAGASVADTFEALDQKGRHSSVCFVVVHLPEGEVQGNLGESGDLKYFSSFRDIAHVATVSDTPTAVLLRGVLGSSYKNPSGMIFSISDDGLKMHLLHYGAPERSSHTDAFSVGFDSDPFGVSAAGDSSSVSPGLETLTIINTYTLQRESFRVWINSDGNFDYFKYL